MRWGNQFWGTRGKKIGAIVLCWALVFPSHLHAEKTNSGPSVSLSEFNEVCGDTLKDGKQARKAKSTVSPALGQKFQYFQSAKSSMTATDANDALWKVWAAVGSVCVAACIASISGYHQQFVCIGSSVAAGVADGIITKNFMSAMTSIAAAGGGLMLNGMMNSAGSAGAPKGSNAASSATGKTSGMLRYLKPVQGQAKLGMPKDMGACLVAAGAAFNVYMKHQAKTSSERSAKSSLASAKALVQQSAAQADFTIDPNQAALNAANTTGTGTDGSNGNTNSNTSTQNSETCSQARSSAAAGLVVQCALSNDRTIPTFVQNSRFKDDFKNASGMPLDSFLKNNSMSPDQAMASTMSGTLNPTQAGQLTAALQQMKEKLPIDVPSSIYAGGGGSGSGHSGRGGGDDLNGVMSQVMSQFMPKAGQGEEDNQNGMQQVIFANKNRNPAAIPEDQTISIFDRVTYRYYYVGYRILGGGNQP